MLIRIGALSSELPSSDQPLSDRIDSPLSLPTEIETMIEQVGGALYQLLHQHHVGFNVIRYQDDIAVIARTEDATYVQLFPQRGSKDTE